jgi:hypothetical protein
VESLGMENEVFDANVSNRAGNPPGSAKERRGCTEHHGSDHCRRAAYHLRGAGVDSPDGALARMPAGCRSWERTSPAGNRATLNPATV